MAYSGAPLAERVRIAGQLGLRPECAVGCVVLAPSLDMYYSLEQTHNKVTPDPITDGALRMLAARMLQLTAHCPGPDGLYAGTAMDGTRLEGCQSPDQPSGGPSPVGPTVLHQ